MRLETRSFLLQILRKLMRRLVTQLVRKMGVGGLLSSSLQDEEVDRVMGGSKRGEVFGSEIGEVVVRIFVE